MFSNKLKSFVRDYFTLNSRERRGALVLAFLIVIQLAVIIRQQYIRTPPLPEVLEFQTQIDRFRSDIAEEGKKNATVAVQKDAPTLTHPIRLFSFDPNTISDEEWMELGFSRKQVSIIRNFLDKGGSFRMKDDLSKIYTVSPDQFRRVEPYIDLPDKITFKKQFPEAVKTVKTLPLVNLNTADTTELCTLPLIGPGRARMIWRYREALGGFVSASQLLEVYNIDSSVVAALHGRIFIDPSVIRKVNMNSDTLRHPYLPKDLAKIIRAYVKQHGKLKGTDDLLKVDLIKDELLDKLAPYASFE